MLEIAPPNLSAKDNLSLMFMFGSAPTGQYYPCYLDPAIERTAFVQRILVRLLGPQEIGVDASHFTGPTRIYLAWCNVCRRYYCDYAHGFNGRVQCEANHFQSA